MAPKPSRERQAAWRERVRQDRAYIAALEAAVRDAADYRTGQRLWMLDHATTIARARGATTTTATEEEKTMAGKKASLTPTQIREAGFVVEQYVPTAAGPTTRANPWVLRRIGSMEYAQRFASRGEAVAELQDQLNAAAQGVS